MKTWTLKEAQHQFKDLVESCSEEPQILSTHGEPIAAIVNFELFRTLLSFQQGGGCPTIPELIAELREIQKEEPIESEIPERQDRFNPFMELTDEFSL